MVNRNHKKAQVRKLMHDNFFSFLFSNRYHIFENFGGEPSAVNLCVMLEEVDVVLSTWPWGIPEHKIYISKSLERLNIYSVFRVLDKFKSSQWFPSFQRRCQC